MMGHLLTDISQCARRTRARILSTLAVFALVLPALVGAGCLDVRDGETGHYTTPCSGSFYEILLCARDTGGAPVTGEPISGVGESRFTCANACQRLVDCGFIPTEDDEACTSSCLMDASFDQDLLNCIRDNECNVNSCFTDL